MNPKHNSAMLGNCRPRVIAAERLHGSVVITFDDNRCALYPNDLLYDILAEARELSAGTFDREVAGVDGD